ncbi:hypothetical protein PoB_002624200 [Plakobranchus ocellatus]|uniref:Uncharacterized protein n=1 Tax=Plakobranchus ocellatus TaxID=259542 RepID=A0AAV3ZXC8_9GAST|nr:hypothetical protein PoB_002624200 [Plakobranchus ocellatus]
MSKVKVLLTTHQRVSHNLIMSIVKVLLTTHQRVSHNLIMSKVKVLLTTHQRVSHNLIMSTWQPCGRVPGFYSTLMYDCKAREGRLSALSLASKPHRFIHPPNLSLSVVGQIAANGQGMTARTLRLRWSQGFFAYVGQGSRPYDEF